MFTMRMRFGGGKAAVCLLALGLLAASGSSSAQRGGGGPGGPGGGPGGGGMGPGGGGMGGPGGGGFPGGGAQPRGQQPGGGVSVQPRAGGLSVGIGGRAPAMGGHGGALPAGPAGRWWDEKHYVQNLKLRPEQQQRMDSVFDNNRAQLQQTLGQLQQEQQRLATMERSKNIDDAALLAQIDRVSVARTALEKADAHVRLELRKEMDAEQVNKLEKEQ